MPLSACSGLQACIVIAIDDTMMLEAVVTYSFLGTYLFAVFFYNLYPYFSTNINCYYY